MFKKVKKEPQEPNFDTEDFYKTQEEIDYVNERTLELRAVLEKVDITLLLDIFMEIYKKSIGYAESDEYALLVKFRNKLRDLLLQQVRAEYSGRMGREYAFYNNGSIKVNSKIFERIPEIGILKIVLHEFVHGFSGQSGMGLMYRDDSEKVSYLEDNRFFSP